MSQNGPSIFRTWDGYPMYVYSPHDENAPQDPTLIDGVMHVSFDGLQERIRQMDKINPATGYVHDDSQLEEPKEIQPVEEVVEVPEEKAAE